MPFYQIDKPGARSGKLSHALYILLSGAPASPGVLQLVLDGTKDWDNAMKLGNPRVIPACVKLLGDYHSPIPLGGPDQGDTLSLSIISLSFQIILLLNRSTALPYSGGMFPTSVYGMTDCIFTMLRTQILSYEKRATASNSSPTIFVPGLTPADAAVLLDWLYGERTSFVMGPFSSSDHRQGLSVLLYGFWAHLRSGKRFNCESAEAKLHDLVCRFACTRSNDDNEELLVITLVSRTKELVMASEDPCVSLEDDASESFLGFGMRALASSMYTKRVKEARPPLDTSLILMDWAEGLTDPDKPGPTILLLDASYLRLWTSLDLNKEDAPLTPHQIGSIVSYTDHLIKHTRKMLEWPNVDPVTRETLVGRICKIDILGLLGRVLFCPITADTSGWNANDKETVRRAYDLLLSQISQLGNSFFQHCRSNLSNFDKLHPDWFKPMIYLEEGCRTFSQDSFIQTHISKCLSAWCGLERVFPDTPRVRTAVCSYPKCPYPVLIGRARCDRCESTEGCRRLQCSEHMHGGFDRWFTQT